MTASPVTGPLVVGVLYPPLFHGSTNAFGDAMARLDAADPAIEVVVEAYIDDAALRTRRSVPGFEPSPADRQPLTDAQREMLERIDVAVALDLPFDTPALAPRLRWVQAVGTGIGQLLSAGLPGSGIRLTNAAGTSAPEIAEFVIARVLEHRKRLPTLRGEQDQRRWRAHYGKPVAGSTVGLAGFGAINAAVAQLARGLGMRVVATRRSPQPGQPPAGVDAVYAPRDLRKMLPECDAVIAALPETAETIGVFGAEEFEAMMPGALFCNVGRGSAVDDEALVEALSSGHLGAAALDVFNAEPLPADHKYWRTPKLRISAHCSSSPSATIQRVEELFRDNLARFRAGRPLRNEVDIERGY